MEPNPGGEAYQMAKVHWQPGHPGRMPPPGHLHLWRCRLDAMTGDPTLLSPAEHRHLARLQRPQLQIAWLAARTFLRTVLGACLERNPATLVLHTGPHGKPFLADESLQFNLSHSGDWALLALAADFPVGVDLERVRPSSHATAIARRHFSPDEAAAVAAATGARRHRFFCQCWTRLEARHKLGGGGLAVPPPPAQLFTFEAAPDHPASVAWPPGRCHGHALRFFDFSPPGNG